MDFVENTRDEEHKVRELHRFYGVSSLANLPRVKAYEASFRCGQARDASSYALAAWIRCAEARAAKIPAGPFDRIKLKETMADIRALCLKSPDEFISEVKKLLARCGVVFVLLPHFMKTSSYGATFWIKPDKAVLVMSFRGKWADIFWFSLLHELGQILLHKKETFIDDGEVSPGLASQEKEADDFAANALIGAARFESFVRMADFSKAAIETFARELGVSAGIVIGRLQHEGRLRQDTELNRLRARYAWKS